MKTLLIMVVSIGLLVIVLSIIIGIRSFDGMVAQNPYERGLKWDETNKKKRELGLAIEIKNTNIHTGENNILFKIYRNNGSLYLSPSIRVFITRPSTNRYDAEVVAQKIKEGLYKAKINFPVYGYWYLVIKPEDYREAVEFKKEIFVEERAHDKDRKKLKGVN